MNPLFRNLQAQAGINASLVLDGSGQLVAFEGSTLYDEDLLEQVAVSLAQALDAVDLLHAEWDEMQVQFGDGAIMVRNLGVVPGRPGRSTLAAIGDSSLNRSFVTVAMRVVAQKVKQALATGADLRAKDHHSTEVSSSTAQPGRIEQSHLRPTPPDAVDNNQSEYGNATAPSGQPLGLRSPYTANGPYQGVPIASTNTARSQPELGSGLAWSGVDNNRSSGFGVSVSDRESLELLTMLARSLAPFVGPMAKVFVKEAVQQVCANGSFSKNHYEHVVRILESQVEDPADCKKFLISIKAV